MINLSKVLKEKDRRKILCESPTNPLQKFQNHLYHINGPQILKRILDEKRSAKTSSKNEFKQPTIDDHILAIHKLADELLSQGDYIEVINYFKQVSSNLLKGGFLKEAEQFEKRSIEIYNLLKLRAEFLTLLEREKVSKKSSKITFLYQEIIEISKKLNDTFWIDELQKELEEFQKELEQSQAEIHPNQTMSEKLEVKSEALTTLDTEALLTLTENDETTLNLRENILKFVIEKLLRNREYFEKQAISFEKKSLFKIAAQFYEKCEETVSHVIRLGISDEQETAKYYRNKKVDCLKRISKK